MSDLIETFRYVLSGAFGFRFLFSTEYRDIVITRWRKQPKLLTLFEIVESVIGIAVIAFIIAVIAALIGG